MNKEEGIILDDGRWITTFEELEDEFLKLSTDYQFIRTNFEFTDNALRKAKDEIVIMQSKYENDTKQLKTEISWLKQMIKGLVDLSMVILKGENNE